MPHNRRGGDRDVPLHRIANRVHDQYARRAAEQNGQVMSAVLESALRATRRNERLVQMCRSRGWDAATSQMRRRYCNDLFPLVDRIISQQQAHMGEPPQVPSLREVYEELKAAEEEFGKVRWMRTPDRVAVTTEPIELEGVHLGPFRIEIVLKQLGIENLLESFAVEAIKPVPAPSDHDVTHPHVNAGGLCPGEGGMAIARAIDEGRLCDFFTLVRSVLQTYNDRSAYVRLEDWGGANCFECGTTVSQDDLSTCSSCDEQVCGDCLRSCSCCPYEKCQSCMSRTTSDRQWICNGCAGTCQHCEGVFPADDLEGDLCAACAEETSQTPKPSPTQGAPT